MSENINMGGEFYSAIIGEKSTGVYNLYLVRVKSCNLVVIETFELYYLGNMGGS